MAKRAYLVGVVGLALYAGAFLVFVDRSVFSGLHATALVLLAAAIGFQLAALWLFGELFRQGVSLSGETLSPGEAFRAALVGSSTARLLPAGGAVTPVAMSWAVRRQAVSTGGAAVRATALNYGSLLVATGICLALLQVGGRLDGLRGLGTVSAGLAVVGGVVMLAAVRLATVARLLPDRLRRRLASGLADTPLDLRSVLFLGGRVAAEAVVLALVLGVFGVELGIVQVGAAFGISQIAAGIPGTPGGLGFAEAGLVGALAVFGVAAPVALAPVLVFRLISYWVPAGAGLLAGTATFWRTAG